MSFVSWSSDLATGLRDIDEQNKRLIDTLNQISFNYETDASYSIVLAFKSLYTYVEYHHKYEEDRFRVTNYPDIQHHQYEHQYHREQLLLLKDVCRKGSMLDVQRSLWVIKRWVINHILTYDKPMAVYIINAEKNEQQKSKSLL